jgi:hypothetical protein
MLGVIRARVDWIENRSQAYCLQVGRHIMREILLLIRVFAYSIPGALVGNSFYLGEDYVKDPWPAFQ